jgi:hypothetical protein
MTHVQTFDLGFNQAPRPTPTLPEPLDQTVYQTREAVREYQNAVAAFYEHQRHLENKARIDEDNKRARELAESKRELTDIEYDAMKKTQWQAEKDKQAARLQKEMDDALARTAYLLSSPPVADLLHRSEYSFLKDFEYWVGQRQYTLGADGLIAFQPGLYHAQLTAPVAKKAVSK